MGPAEQTAITPAAPVKKELGVHITQAAVDAIGAQIKKRNVPGTSLRVGVKGGGCSGFSYVIEFYDGEPHARDRIYDRVATDGSAVRIVVDPKSLIYLNDATFEYENTLMRKGFLWKNPQEKNSCGCGTSFAV
jgi:iron-sulfur cluster assembly protein